MASKNNKGFSLVEIIIAIAVLTLLLTPIMQQFSQTLRTSRLAKEQQYANEAAIYSLEHAQMATHEDIVAEYSTTYTDFSYKLAADNPSNVRTCELVDNAGNSLGSITYHIDEYNLGNIKLGARQTEYTRTLTIDDIAAQVRSVKAADGSGYKIMYGLDETNLPAGYTLTSEGSAVQYEGNYISKIVCESADYVGNPNEANLGNMQDLDIYKVALVNGTSSRFDAQAETALYSLAMDKLKEIDYASWQQAMLNKFDDNVLNQYAYSNIVNKVTKIYLEEGTDGTNKYYDVKVDVYYVSHFSLEVNNKVHDYDEYLKYNVFSQRFITTECPDIYFEYQPYVLETTENGLGSYNVIYAKDDYLLIDNHVDDAKLYIYKPFQDAMNVAENIDSTSYAQGTYTYYTHETGDSRRSVVNINIANVNSAVKPMNIFTNLDVTDNGADSQFVCNAAFFNSTDKVKEIESDNEASATLTVKTEFDRTYLKSLDEDVRYNDRLKTVTVTVAPVSENANTISLTGAKGEK